jgi:hypothetical protein
LSSPTSLDSHFAMDAAFPMDHEFHFACWLSLPKNLSI